MGVPEPAARPARERQAHLEVTLAFDFDPPPQGEPRRIAKEHGVAVRAKNPRYATLAYVPELQTFFSGREDGAIAQWRARMFHDHETVRVSPSRPAFTLRGHVGKVTALLPIAPVPGRFTHGTLVTGGADASIRVWDPRQVNSSGAQLQHLRDHKGAVLALEQCVDKLVSGCTRGEVRLWAPYDAQRPSDDDITGVADAARRAPIGVTYALFQPLRVLCSFGSSSGVWVTGLSFGQTASVGDHGTLFVATSAGSVFRVRGAKPRGGGDGDESGSDGDASDWDDGASANGSLASHKSAGSMASSEARAKMTGGFSAFMNLRPPPETTFAPSAEAEPFRDFAAEDASLATRFEPSELEALGLPFDPSDANGGFHRPARVTHVSYYPSERLVLTLSRDGVARLTDSASGARRAAFEDADGARFVDGRVSVNDAAGARVLYLVDDRGDVRLYDILDMVGVDPRGEPRCARHVTGFVNARDDDGDLKRSSRVPAAGLVSVPEAKAVATLSALGRVCGLRVTRDASFEVVRDAFGVRAHDRAVSGVAVGRVDAGRRKLARAGTRASRADDASDLSAPSEAEDLVFTASPDGTMKQRDPFDLMCVRAHDVLRLSDVTAVLVAASAGGKLVTGHDDGSVRAWDVVSGDAAAARGAHENAVSCLCEIARPRPTAASSRASSLARDSATDEADEGNPVVSGGFDGRLVVWRVSRGREPPERKKTWRAHDGEVLAVAPREAETAETSAATNETRALRASLFFSCGNDGLVKLWRGADDLVRAWRAHSEPATCVSSLGARVFTGSEDGTVRVWDASGDFASAERARRSSRSNRACSSDPGPETKAPRLLLTLDARAGPVVGARATREPRGGKRHLVTASAGAVCVWDVTETPPETPPGTTKPSIDGSRVSLGSFLDAKARVDPPPAATECLPDIGARAETTPSVLERREKETSRTRREVSRFRRDDAFACFALRERENQILVGTRGGDLIALDAFAPTTDAAT